MDEITDLHNRLNRVGRLLRLTGCLRVYRSGERSLDCVFRWWHPVSWIVFLAAIPVCAFLPYSVLEAVPFTCGDAEPID